MLGWEMNYVGVMGFLLIGGVFVDGVGGLFWFCVGSLYGGIIKI